MAEVEWYIDRGADLVPGAVTLRAPYGQAVTHDEWRRVKVARVIETSRADVVRTMAETHVAETVTNEPDSVEDVVQVLTAHVVPGPPHGRSSWSDDHYRRVAEVYRAAVANSERPVVAVMREVGTPDYTPRSTAKGWVQEARRRGLIPPGRHTEWNGGR